MSVYSTVMLVVNSKNKSKIIGLSEVFIIDTDVVFGSMYIQFNKICLVEALSSNMCNINHQLLT